MIEARYSNKDHTIIIAVIDGVEWSGVRLDVAGEIANKVYAWIANGNTPDAYVSPSTSVPQVVSDRQFFQALALMDVITQEEALAAVKTGSIPATLQAFVDTLAAAEKFNVEMLLSGATIFERSHAMTLALGVGLGWTPEQLDELWTTAAAL